MTVDVVKMGTSDFKLCYGFGVLADFTLFFLSGEVIFDPSGTYFRNVQIKWEKNPNTFNIWIVSFHVVPKLHNFYTYREKYIFWMSFFFFL